MSEENATQEKIGTIKDLSGLLEQSRQSAKERKFTQSWDLSIGLKNLDLKKPENRFNQELSLPGGRGRPVRITMIADAMNTEAKKLDSISNVVQKAELEGLAKDKKRLKKLIRDTDFFLGEVSIMPMIAKQIGAVLGPRGKIPRPVPPNVKLDAFVAATSNTIRVSLKSTPVINVAVGTEKMEPEKIIRNIEAVLNMVKEKLPKGEGNIKSISIKLSMGRPFKIKV